MPLAKQKFKSFGEHLRTLRGETELPLREVASHLGIDPSLLAKIERNERQPTKGLITRIAKIFSQDENFLTKQFISDQFAYKIYEEDADIEILKVAEEKVKYLRKTNKA